MQSANFERPLNSLSTLGIGPTRPKHLSTAGRECGDGVSSSHVFVPRTIRSGPIGRNSKRPCQISSFI
jgi:hypothetical protein